MATLKQLIDDGLGVGVLVKHNKFDFIMQYEKEYDIIKKCFSIIRANTNQIPIVDFMQMFDTNNWYTTTAHDSEIDYQTLPIPEPFWTGWAAIYADGWNLFEYRQDLKDEIARGELWDYRNNLFHTTDCRPCLPPKTNP